MSDALIDQRLWEMDTGFEAYKLIQLINEFNQNTSIMEIWLTCKIKNFDRRAIVRVLQNILNHGQNKKA